MKGACIMSNNTLLNQATDAFVELDDLSLSTTLSIEQMGFSLLTVFENIAQSFNNAFCSIISNLESLVNHAMSV